MFCPNLLQFPGNCPGFIKFGVLLKHILRMPLHRFYQTSVSKTLQGSAGNIIDTYMFCPEYSNYDLNCFKYALRILIYIQFTKHYSEINIKKDGLQFQQNS